jgi:hypothetical protein
MTTYKMKDYNIKPNESHTIEQKDNLIASHANTILNIRHALYILSEKKNVKKKDLEKVIEHINNILSLR